MDQVSGVCFLDGRCLEQAGFLPYPKGEMFTAPEGAHQVLLAEVYFSSDPVDNLGVGVHITEKSLVFLKACSQTPNSSFDIR